MAGLQTHQIKKFSYQQAEPGKTMAGLNTVPEQLFSASENKAQALFKDTK